MCAVPRNGSSYGDIAAVGNATNVWFMPQETADQKHSFEFDVSSPTTAGGGMLSRVKSGDGDQGCKTAVHHIESVDEATGVINKMGLKSLGFVAYSGHGNGQRIMWGNGSSHNDDGADNNLFGLYQNTNGLSHFEALRPKLRQGAAIHLDSCLSASPLGLDDDGPFDIGIPPNNKSFKLINNTLAVWVAYQAPKGTFVIASTDCFSQDDVSINKGDHWLHSRILGFIRFPNRPPDPRENTVRVFAGSHDCRNKDWEMPSEIVGTSFGRDIYYGETGHLSGNTHVKDYHCDAAFLVTRYLCLEEFEEYFPGARDACCFCGGGEWPSS